MSDATIAAPRPTVAHRAEYAAWRTAVAVLARVPLGATRACASTLGRLGYRPLRIRRRVVDHQIKSAFPELDADARRRIASGSYAYLGRLAAEAAVVSTRSPDALRALFHPPIGWEHLQRAHEEQRGVILVSGHFGNWELGLSYIALRGIPVTAVARRMRNPLFEGYVTRARARLRLNLIAEADAVRGLPKLLAAAHVVPMLADQGSKRISSTFVPFFGRLARTPRGPALLALRHKPVMLFMAAPCEPDGKYRLAFEPVDVIETGDRDADVNAIVARYTARLEAWVRRYPEQYLWQHRRWRRRPDGSLEDV